MTDKVKVKSYYRDGEKVRSHTRSLPREGGVKISRVLASNSENNSEDTLMIKEALQSMGYYEPPKDIGMHSHPDSQLFDAVKEFQKDNNLKVDGIIKPNGETEKVMNEVISKNKSYMENVNSWHEEFKRINALPKVSDVNKHQYMNCIAMKGNFDMKATAAIAGFGKEGLDMARKFFNKEDRDNYKGFTGIYKDSIRDTRNNYKGANYGKKEGTRCLNLLEKSID